MPSLRSRKAPSKGLPAVLVKRATLLFGLNGSLTLLNWVPPKALKVCLLLSKSMGKFCA